MSAIYLDHNATSPLRPEARAAMMRLLDGPQGNPSSPHSAGHRARMTIEGAREAVARLIGAAPDDIVLTSGGTEANNLALYGAAMARGARGAQVADGRRIVISGFEHPSVRAVVEDLGERGFEVVQVDPDRQGRVDPDAILAAAVQGTAVVSVMLANNEVGTVQPVRELGAMLRRRSIPLHSDAAQAAGKMPIDVEDLCVDLLSLAAHKFGGPQGAGALYIRRGHQLRPHLRGGGQELNRRPGTENVVAAAGMGAAASAALAALPSESARLTTLRGRLEETLAGPSFEACIHGAGSPRIPNTTSAAFEGVTGEGLVIGLDLEGVCVSAGSACSAGTIRRSPSLAAMGLEAEAERSIRISTGSSTTEHDIELFLERLRTVLSRIRSTQLVPGGSA